tara:strand:- start:465 stop:677 length:213 start_codon:yes stop_codon:yes gene_type:complete
MLKIHIWFEEAGNIRRKTLRRCNNCGFEEVTSRNSHEKARKNGERTYCGTMVVADKQRRRYKLDRPIRTN